MGSGKPPLVILIGEAARDHGRIEEHLNEGAVVVVTLSEDLAASWLSSSPANISRRVSATFHGGQQLRCDGLEIDLSSFRVSWRGEKINVTRHEVMILDILAEDPGRAVSFAEFSERVWGGPYHGDSESVRSIIKRIRKKLAEAGMGAPIESVWGVGFRLRDLHRDSLQSG